MQSHVGGVELRAREGRAVLVDRGGVGPELTLRGCLEPALHEWAAVACALGSLQAVDESAAQVSRRGRQLATLLASDAGVPVGYADPIRGVVEEIPPEPTPWGPGLVLAGFATVFCAILVVALTTGFHVVGDWFAVVGNLMLAGGAIPLVRMGSRLPVWRWLAYGAIVGYPIGCLAALATLVG